MASTKYDVLIIGGGHNGLTCACYLAERGYRVRILERRHIVGGAAVTEEFYPGFRNSTVSYTVSLLSPKVIRDLRLYQHGLRIVERSFANFLPLSDCNYFKFGGEPKAARAEVARFSERDAERLPRYYQMLERVADVLREFVLESPPNLEGGLSGLMTGLKIGGRLKKLSARERRDLLDLFTKSAGDMLNHWFESEPLKAALGFDSVVGNYGSPYDSGSAYVQLHHCFGEVNGKKGVWGHAIGGMGSITEAMAKEAKIRGVEISTNSSVKSVNIHHRRAHGVTLVSGETISATKVVANVNPKLLFLELIDPSHLDPEVVSRMQAYKCASGTFRMNVALSELPDFTCLPGKEPLPHHSSGIIMAPSLEYMERAYHDARRYGWSREPIVEMLIPSTVDDSLAPRGAHVASLFCQQFAPTLPDGRSWDLEREVAADLVIDTVTKYAPNFKRSVIARQIHSPFDLEQKFGLIGGDIFHGALSLDQLYAMRPMLGMADYTTTIAGLYGCGAGWHPGGGVTGLPGRNAAMKIMSDR